MHKEDIVYNIIIRDKNNQLVCDVSVIDEPQFEIYKGDSVFRGFRYDGNIKVNGYYINRDHVKNLGGIIETLGKDKIHLNSLLDEKDTVINKLKSRVESLELECKSLDETIRNSVKDSDYVDCLKEENDRLRDIIREMSNII